MYAIRMTATRIVSILIILNWALRPRTVRIITSVNQCPDEKRDCHRGERLYAARRIVMVVPHGTGMNRAVPSLGQKPTRSGFRLGGQARFSLVGERCRVFLEVAAPYRVPIGSPIGSWLWRPPCVHLGQACQNSRQGLLRVCLC